MNIFSPKTKSGVFSVLIFIILAVTIIIAGHLYYRNYKKNFRREVESRLTAIAELKALNLSLWRQERLGDANIYYNNASLIDLAQNYFERPEDRHCQEALKEWSNRINTNDYDGVFLLDAAGSVRLTIFGIEEKISGFAKQQTRDAMQSGKVTFVDFFRHEDSGKIFLDLVIPLINRTDGERIIGALVWRIDPKNYLYPFIQQWPETSRTAETLIVRKEGNDVLFLNELKFQKDTALNLRFPLESGIMAAQAAEGKKGILEGKDYRGVPVIADVRPIPDSPWFMVNRMDMAEVFAPLKETYLIIVILISSLLLAFLFGVLFWQKRYAENALRESKEDLSITLHSIGDAMIATDAEGRITRMNPVAEKLTGWPLAEAAGKPLEEVFRIINAQTREPVQNPIAKVLGSGQIVGLANHTALIARDGTEHQIADSAAPILDVQGRIRGIVLVFHDVTNEYKAREALREKTEELDRYFTLSLDLLCIADTDGYFHRLNPEWEKTLGYSVQELQGKLFLDFVHPEDMAATIATISRLKDQKEVLNFENRYRCKNGAYRWIEWRSYPSGKMVYAAARDVTERKRAEKELRGIAWLLTKTSDKKRNEPEYCPEYGDLTELNTNPAILRYVGKNFLEEIVLDFMKLLGTSSAVYEKDGSYALGIFSSGWCRFLDLTSRRLCDTPDNKKALCSGRWLCHESCWTDCAKKVLETGQPADIECNGGIHLYAVPVLAGNDIVGAINFGYGSPPQDEQKLQELAKRYNVGVEELRKYSREYETRPQFIIEIAKERLLTSAKLIGEIVERKRAEEMLTETNKQLQDTLKTASKLAVEAQAANIVKGQFVGNISREIRTPLNGIVGICELLLETKMTDEQNEYAQIINSSAEALLNIINSTLDFSKIEAGKMELEHIDFNLRVLLEEIIKLFSVDAAQKKLQMIDFIEQDLPINLNGDPGRLRQILSNLIGNAIKFTSAGDITITVALAEEKEGKTVLRFSVRDTGIGIPADKTNLFFNAFSQVDASLARRFGGTGLGLAISKGLVEQMGGSIGVESVLGKGSTFWFIIPFIKQRSDAQPSESPAGSGKVLEGTDKRGLQKHEQYQPGKRLRILVAEDNMANQMVILNILEKMGHSAIAVADGKEVVKLLETIPYDLVLMDIQMPEMDGLEAAAIIRDPRSQVRDHNIPIMALTAHTMQEDREKCLSAGMNGYITKPVSTKSIADALANIASPDNTLAPKDKDKPVPSDEPVVVFDSKTFSDRLSDDNALIREIINIFLDETPKSMRELGKNIKKQQKDDVARLAHTIKGSAANVSGNKFHAVALKIETACSTADWREAEALIPRLGRQFEMLERAMREYLKKAEGG